jgi:hypothetical protein
MKIYLLHPNFKKKPYVISDAQKALRLIRRDPYDYALIEKNWRAENFYLNFTDTNLKLDISPACWEILGFSTKSRSAFEATFGQDSLFLPLKENSEISIFIPPSLDDSLNIDNLKTSEYEKDRYKIIVYSFFETSLSNKPVFRLSERYFHSWSSCIYVTDTFLEFVDKNKLKFPAIKKLVWDSEDPDYFDERYNDYAHWQNIKREVAKE